MKRAKRTIVILSLALASCGGPVLSPVATPQVLNLRLMATAATAPLLSNLVNAYNQAGLGRTLLAVDLTTAGWSAVQTRLLAGEISFATTTTLAPGFDLWAAPIALDGIAIIVHPANPVPALTTADLRAIFLGRTTAWDTLGGPDLPITPASYETGDDLRLSFEALVLNNSPITLGARLVLSPRGMIDFVTNEPGAIGYVTLTALALIDPGGVRVVALDPGDDSPVLPTPLTLSAGDTVMGRPAADELPGPRYPLALPVLVVGREPPDVSSPAYALFAWMQSDSGQAVVNDRLEAVAAHYP